MDLSHVRKDFPTLDRDIRGKRLVFLDSGASSLTPKIVLDVMDDVYRYMNANVHRGVHLLSEEASELYENSRKIVADFVGCKEKGVVYTKNATEALNLLAYSWARNFLKKGDTLIIPLMEHHANIVPWQLASEQVGFEICYLNHDENGQLDIDHFKELLATKNVKGLSVTGVSNVLGTINPLKELGQMLKAAHKDAKFIVDGAQLVPHMPVNFSDIGADAMVFSGHKMLGPYGIGVLVADPKWLDELPPFLSGGDMILDVTTEGAVFNEVPLKFEAGTPPIAEVIGLSAAITYLNKIGMENVFAHDQEIMAYCLEELSKIEGLSIHGSLDPKKRSGVVSFALKDLHPHDIGTVVDREGVAIRVGHHCAKPLVRNLGSSSTSRASFNVYTTKEDIDALVLAVKKTQDFFG